MSLPVVRIIRTNTETNKSEYIQTFIYNVNYDPELTSGARGQVMINPPGKSTLPHLQHPNHNNPLLKKEEASIMLRKFFEKKPDHEIFNCWHVEHYQGPPLPLQLKKMIQECWNTHMVSRLDKNDTPINNSLGPHSHLQQRIIKKCIVNHGYSRYEDYKRIHNISFKGRIALEDHENTRTSKINNALDIFQDTKGTTFLLFFF